MAIVPTSEMEEATMELIAALQRVLTERPVTNSQAIDAAVQNLALVLINACETEAECLGFMVSINQDIEQFIKQNYAAVVNTRALAKTTRMKH